MTSAIHYSPGSLEACQREFAAVLLDPDLPVPRGLTGPDGKASVKRFNVYRNNVTVGLVEALKAAFPAVCRIVGEAFFAAMARIYVARQPPESPVMLNYGATFPAFIDAFEPAQSVPYLGDVARLERAWVEAFHAAEAQPADLARLGAIDAARLPQVGFTLHPSVRVVRSSFPVVELWLMNIDGGLPAPIDMTRGGEHAIVVRPDADVEVRRVTSATATFVAALATGLTVAEAATLALNDDPAFDLANALAALFAMSAITGWSVHDAPDSTSVARCA